MAGTRPEWVSCRGSCYTAPGESQLEFPTDAPQDDLCYEDEDKDV